eukprot:10502584-Alexandrium_andersonii.AAC.1
MRREANGRSDAAATAGSHGMWLRPVHATICPWRPCAAGRALMLQVKQGKRPCGTAAPLAGSHDRRGRPTASARP